jgi:hypothetical protein
VSSAAWTSRPPGLRMVMIAQPDQPRPEPGAKGR